MMDGPWAFLGCGLKLSFTVQITLLLLLVPFNLTLFPPSASCQSRLPPAVHGVADVFLSARPAAHPPRLIRRSCLEHRHRSPLCQPVPGQFTTTRQFCPSPRFVATSLQLLRIALRSPHTAPPPACYSHSSFSLTFSPASQRSCGNSSVAACIASAPRSPHPAQAPPSQRHLPGPIAQACLVRGGQAQHTSPDALNPRPARKR